MKNKIRFYLLFLLGLSGLQECFSQSKYCYFFPKCNLGNGKVLEMYGFSNYRLNDTTDIHIYDICIVSKIDTLAKPVILGKRQKAGRSYKTDYYFIKNDTLFPIFVNNTYISSGDTISLGTSYLKNGGFFSLGRFNIFSSSKTKFYTREGTKVFYEDFLDPIISQKIFVLEKYGNEGELSWKCSEMYGDSKKSTLNIYKYEFGLLKGVEFKILNFKMPELIEDWDTIGFEKKYVKGSPSIGNATFYYDSLKRFEKSKVTFLKNLGYDELQYGDQEVVYSNNRIKSINLSLRNKSSGANLFFIYKLPDNHLNIISRIANFKIASPNNGHTMNDLLRNYSTGLLENITGDKSRIPGIESFFINNLYDMISHKKLMSFYPDGSWFNAAFINGFDKRIPEPY